jgi:DNA-binding MarR family transcriptional regulator
MDSSERGPAPDQGCIADRVWTLLLQVSFDRTVRFFGATAAELDLAPAQAMAMQELDAEQPISMRDLAGRLRCHPSNITGLVDRLEARGLVERRPDPRDRRVKGLALTPTGEKVRRRLSAMLNAAPACVAHLPEPDQHQLYELLLKIVNHK